MTASTEAASRRPLRRSGTERVIAGVAGGLAQATGMSPAAVRAAFVVLTVLPPGIGPLTYLLAWILLPSDAASAGTRAPGASSRPVAMLVGTVLVTAGLAVALEVSVPSWIDGRHVAAAVLVLLGAGLLVRGARD